MPAPTALRAGSYARFVTGAGGWFVAWGMHLVVQQWLVVEVLGERPARVGAAQMALLLPSILLLLPAGAAVDRVRPTGLLMALHALAAAVFLGLGAVVALGRLSYEAVLVFAAALGAIQAFQVPAREGQLHAVSGAGIQRGVVGANLAQQGGQAVGGLLAATASVLGAPLVLAVQAVLVLAGAAAQADLRAAAAPAPSREVRSTWREARAGVSLVARDPVLRGTFVLTTAIGLLFVGPYSVLLPLLVRDVYGAGAGAMGVLVAMLPLGGILAGSVLFASGGTRRHGRALLGGQAFSACCLGAIGLGLPFAGTALCVLGWGAGSAFFLNAGRTLFHVRAPDEDRGKALAVYAFGILGAGPLGALLSGALAEAVGVHGAMGLQAAAMLATLFGVACSPSLRRA